MRSLALGLALCAVSALLGCDAATPPPRAGVVTFAVGGAPAEFDHWERLVRVFERKTGIRVELLRQPTDTGLRRQGLTLPLQAQISSPDVFLMDVAWVARFAASGWLEPLSPHLGKGGCAGKELFFPRMIETVDTHEGAVVALPVYVDGGLLYYRKDLLEKYGLPGPPRTWDELLRQSETVQRGERRSRPGFHAFAWQGAQYEGLVCDFLEFAGPSGGFRVENGAVTVDTPQNRKALRFMRDLIGKYGISPPNTYTEMREEEVRSFFQEGYALFERNWPYAWPLHEGPGSPVRGKTGIAALPGWSPGEGAACLGGWHAGISRFSDAKPESVKFLCFLVSYETQRDLALHLGWNPGRRDVYADPELLAKNPHLKALRAVFENARARPLLPYYSRLSEILQRRLTAALAGTSTPEEALSAADQEMRAALSRYR
ncbi:MAG: ABC transporter substrate-binding protein [Deltaproteobacteria bacterium]|nr:ABC transporter substrate-binding protein [Deltaproteobacteria bacterium]